MYISLNCDLSTVTTLRALPTPSLPPLSKTWAAFTTPPPVLP